LWLRQALDLSTTQVKDALRSEHHPCVDHVLDLSERTVPCRVLAKTEDWEACLRAHIEAIDAKAAVA
jgi:hypothetical protein